MAKACALIIGNEILTGKIQDTNSRYLINAFYARGIDLERIVFIRDVFDEIVSEVRELSARYDIVVTSGGIGPTHDDITIEAVAEAMNRELVVHPQLEALYLSYNRENDPEILRKMISMPAGAVLDFDGVWPAIRVDNVHIFPGVPFLFERKLDTLVKNFPAAPFFLGRIEIYARESKIARLLIETLEQCSVEIGSYPRREGDKRYVLIIVESRNMEDVDLAVNDLVERLEASEIEHRVLG